MWADIEKALNADGGYRIEFIKLFWGLRQGVRITKKDKGA
jgi:hypothetical protein